MAAVAVTTLIKIPSSSYSSLNPSFHFHLRKWPHHSHSHSHTYINVVDYPSPRRRRFFPVSALSFSDHQTNFPTCFQPNAITIDEIEKKESFTLVDSKFSVILPPNTNSFGHNFRDYNAESERQEGVECFYRINHINQTYQFVKKMREEYGELDRVEMGIWECCEFLNDVVDESDPDLDEPQIQHLLQTAESIRKDYPQQDWLHLTALIHDLGKVLLLPSFGGLPQWAVVGDTFPVGCAFDESIVHFKYFQENPDFCNAAYNTKYGIYTPNCGLKNVMMSWGHDDYMYLVAKQNETTLPSAALFIVRYHSFYSLHKSSAYKHLMDEEDVENLKWLQIFNKYDLYSKSKVRINVNEVKPYYISLINKYFPSRLQW